MCNQNCADLWCDSEFILKLFAIVSFYFYVNLFDFFFVIHLLLPLLGFVAQRNCVAIFEIGMKKKMLGYEKIYFDCD